MAHGKVTQLQRFSNNFWRPESCKSVKYATAETRDPQITCIAEKKTSKVIESFRQNLLTEATK